MKILLLGLFALSLISCNRVVDKTPVSDKKSDSVTQKDSTTRVVNNQVYRDTLKPVVLENENELLLDSARLMHLVMYFAYDAQYKIIPKIKMYAIYNPRDYLASWKGYRYFYISEHTAYLFSDTLILTGIKDGEMGTSVLTAWKKEGDKYRFISVLEKSLITDARIDSVFNLGRNKYLLAGTTGWGDLGDAAGSIWFAVWELPASFRMIYYDKWFAAYNDNTKYTYNYSFHNTFINLEKLVVNYKSSDFYSAVIHTDWKASKSNINIDLSSKKDLTSDFNSTGE